MHTSYWNVMSEYTNQNQAIEEAAQWLIRGELVAFPTETVYGLGADATNEKAVDKIFKAKERPQDNPLIVHVASKEALLYLVEEIPSYVHELIKAFSPGPITYVLKSNGSCAANVTAGLDTVAVRIPDHPIALELLNTCQIPLAAPSANLSGKPSPTTAAHVMDDLEQKIAGILDGGPTGVGMESTVVDCTGERPIILRPGGITKEQIQSVVPISYNDLIFSKQTMKPTSPGMKYKHYSPEVPLWIVEGSLNRLQQMIKQEQKKGKRVGVLASTLTTEKVEADLLIPLGHSLYEIGAHLYEGLRSFHKNEIDLIISETYPEIEIGEAIMNRLKKAASRIL